MPGVKNNYNKIKFIKSAYKLDQLTEDTGIEVAFAGRSNAGKSSAINTITNINHLAKTSKTPGRTQCINLFEIDDIRTLVDLPGYGYAKVPQKMKRDWQQNLSAYLETRQALVGLFLIMDIRHPMTEYDQHMLEWASSAEIHVHALLTKADKLNKNPAKLTLMKVQKEIQKFHPGFTAQTFSATKRNGVEDARDVLNQLYNLDS